VKKKKKKKKKKKFGQAFLKGNVVHFAQCVEEIHEQLLDPIRLLPLKLTDSSNIIVTEKKENVSTIKQFAVRPQLLYEALIWLQLNNPLYNNIQIIRRDDEDFNLNNITVQRETEIEEESIKENFREINSKYKYSKNFKIFKK
jgi:hypothetical protein